MSIKLWKARVLNEFKKIRAIALIERSNKLKDEWKDNWSKLEIQNDQERKWPLIRWPRIKKESKKGKICVLNECVPIPKGNKWALVNLNQKCSGEKYKYSNEESEAVVDHEPVSDDMFFELVQRLEEKYVFSKKKTNSKLVIFKAINHYFFKTLSPEMLMDKYEELVMQKTVDVLNAKTNISSRSCRDKCSDQNSSGRFLKLFCQRCFIYDCNLHTNHKRSNKHENIDIEKSTHLPNKPCDNDCFLVVDGAGVEDERQCPSWQARKRRRLMVKVEKECWQTDEMELFIALRSIFKDNYCTIAKSMLTKSCKQVYRKVMGENTEKSRPVFNQSVKFKKVSWSKKSRALYGAHMKTNETQKRYPYTPCDHPESLSCSENCSCIKLKNFCEKFCKCHNELCLNRYIGCQCKSQCATKKCPCYCYGRECDPDLCKSCGACKFETKDISCKNINIQRGLRKHLLLAISAVSGWGIFLKHDVKRNEYITEYCGEIITQDEANQRGKLYDEAKSSFLFDLNEEFVIDATRMGSKIRFANHSDKPNCYAKVLKVLGDHRIGIFAKRDILAGEELFFDYKYGPNERRKLLSSDF